MKPARVLCVVLNWNGNGHVVRCIDSLARSKDVVPQIFVVDNGSTDGSLEKIRHKFPVAAIVECPENIGLAKARNLAVQALLNSDIDFAFFLDNDAWCSEDCLTRLVEVAGTDDDAGIVTPRILDAQHPDRIWYDGGRLTPWGDTRHEHFNSRIDDPSVTDLQPRNADFATGCAMLVKRQVFERIGLFDESFFVYCEDSDFSFRARNRGYTVRHVPGAIAWHKQSYDTKANRGKWFRDYYLARNTLELTRRHIHGLQRIQFAVRFCTIRVLGTALYFLVTFQFRRLHALFAGILDFAVRRLGKRYF